MVSLVSVVSFRPFRFVVSGFSTCQNEEVQKQKLNPYQTVTSLISSNNQTQLINLIAKSNELPLELPLRDGF